METFPSEIIAFMPTLGILLFVGALAGIIGGMFGIGGGIVIVPILYHIADKIDFIPGHEMHTIMATSLATIIFTGIASLRTHILHKEINQNILKKLAPLMFLGAIFGAYLNSLLSTRIITGFFAVFCIVLAVKMLNKNRKVQSKHTSHHILHGLSVGIGTISSLMGIGGGTMIVPLLKHIGLSMKIAIGTSSILTSIVATSGTICFIIAGWSVMELTFPYIGYVNWLVLICIVPTIMIGAPIGAWISRQINDITLSRLFALFLFINAIKLLYNMIK